MRCHTCAADLGRGGGVRTERGRETGATGLSAHKRLGNRGPATGRLQKAVSLGGGEAPQASERQRGADVTALWAETPGPVPR